MNRRREVWSKIGSLAGQSGPSFAKESKFLPVDDMMHSSRACHSPIVVKRQPTQVSVVSLSLQHAQRAAAVFHQPWFRCYAGNDPIGVELAGALKNVYALGMALF